MVELADIPILIAIKAKNMRFYIIKAKVIFIKLRQTFTKVTIL